MWTFGFVASILFLWGVDVPSAPGWGLGTLALPTDAYGDDTVGNFCENSSTKEEHVPMKKFLKHQITEAPKRWNHLHPEEQVNVLRYSSTLSLLRICGHTNSSPVHTIIYAKHSLLVLPCDHSAAKGSTRAFFSMRGWRAISSPDLKIDNGTMASIQERMIC